MAYRASRYNYFVEIDNRWAVFNTFSCGLFLLDSAKKDLLSKDDISCLSPTELSSMVEAGLVIDDVVTNEYELLRYHQLSAMYQTERCFYEILPTTGCNARCFYCFEDGVEAKRMTPGTAEATARFIVSHNSSKQYIHLNWFGGEPLLNTEAIDIISAYILSELPNTALHAEMTTNGTLFTDDLIKRAADKWKLKKVQITLDGLKPEYEKRKRYISITDAFERVLTNIEKLATSGIRVSVRLNVDQDNIDSLLGLIEQLGVRFGSYNNVSFYAYPLFDCGKYKAPDVIENARLLLDLYACMVNNGLIEPHKVFGLTRRETQCFARNANGFLISPDGNMYKCSQVIDNPSEVVGNVYTGVKSNAAFLRWVSPSIPEECSSCVLFPLCLSGCKAGELGYGSVRHYIFKNILPDVIRAYVKLNS